MNRKDKVFNNNKINYDLQDDILNELKCGEEYYNDHTNNIRILKNHNFMYSAMDSKGVRKRPFMPIKMSQNWYMDFYIFISIF